MKRTTAVNRMLERKFILPKPQQRRAAKRDPFDAAFAAAMGEPDYSFDVPEPDPVPEPIPATEPELGLRATIKDMRR